MAAPSVPTGLRAYKGDGQVTLFWDPAVDTGTGVQDYTLYRGQNYAGVGALVTTASSASSAAKTIVSSFVAGASGTLFEGRGKLWVDSGTASIQAVVYADSAGAPGALLAISDSVIVSNTTEPSPSLIFPYSGAQQISIANGTTYWIGFTWPDPGVPNITWRQGGVAAAASQNASNPPTNPFGAATTLAGPLSTYVNVVVAAAGAESAIRTGIDLPDDLPLVDSNDVKNGFKYTYSVKAWDTGFVNQSANSLSAGVTPGPAGVPFLEGEL